MKETSESLLATGSPVPHAPLAHKGASWMDYMLPLTFGLLFLIVFLKRERSSGGSFIKKVISSVASLKDHIFSFIRAIPLKLIPFISSCRDKDIEVHDALTKVLHQIEDTQAEVTKIANTDVLGFLVPFLGHLQELLKSRLKRIRILENQIEALYMEFDSLRSSIIRIQGQCNEHKKRRDLWTRIISLAHVAEYLIDFHLVEGKPDGSHIMNLLSRIIEQIKLLQADVTWIECEEIIEASNVPTASPTPVPSQVTGPSTDDVVGFKEEAKKIMDDLVADAEQLDVISIIGMAGLGKTTLARKVYETPSIMNYFHVRAWCSASQTYRKRELLLSVLGDVIKVPKQEIDTLSDEDLAAKLYQSLKRRRYLIVIDDMWHIDTWNDLVRSFPDDRTQSRILITSRLLNVASQTKAASKVHLLREFSDDESWELFQKKLQKESFPQEFVGVGRQIVQSCKRLPLAIVMIAGLLAKVGEDIFMWRQIAENLSSHILNDSESQCKTILELSYNHLLYPLKSCFLYLGAFAEDEEIPVLKLKWLWIAEGFLQNIEAKSSEDIAEEYFVELISRSLVTANKERSLGGVKTCHVHDLLREFCLEKAKEESFLLAIRANNHSFSFFDRDVKKHSGLLRSYDQRRLSIYSDVHDLMEAKPSGFAVRSLLHCAVWEDSYHSGISFICHNFKLLRVLDLMFINIGEFFSGLELLIHLKYLAIRAETNSIPSSIAKLWNLQFFLIKLRRYYHYGGEVVNVPDSLWDMLNLRHVHIINRSASFHVKSSRLVNSSSLLDNLETLSTPCLSYGEDAERLLTRLPKLRKLRCVFKYCWDDSTKCYKFPVMDFLNQLVSLKVFFEGRPHWGRRCELSFPSNLQKLTLSNFRLTWGDISQIGSMLPNLKVLKLIGDDWDDKWDMNDGDFPKLKYLKLSRLIYLQEWIGSEDSLPVLEQLVLQHSWKLKEIPHFFGEISTLRMITVRDCRPSVDDSARRIEKEQREWQNEQLKVDIYPRT